MAVVRITVDAAAGQCLAADGVIGDHALNGQHHGLFGGFRHQGLVLDLLKAADITRVMTVVFLLQLAAGEDCLGSVDDDDMVTAINMGGEGGLVLAAQQNGGFFSGTAQGLAGRIDDVPFAFHAGLCHGSGHIFFLLNIC